MEPVRVRQLRRRFIALTVFVIVVTALSTAWILASERRTLIESAERGTRSYAVALAEHGERTFAETDRAIRNAVDLIAVEGGVSKISPFLLHEILRDAANGAPQIGSLIVVDTSGQMLAHSLESTSKTANVADRDYFAFHRDNPRGGIFISRPLISRVVNRWRFTISRTVTTADGGFGGLVAAAIEIEYFRKLYSSLDLGRNGRASLAREDGYRVVIEPYIEGSFDRNITLSDAYVEARRSSPDVGTYFNPASVVDGTRRIASYQRFRDFPLLAHVAFDYEEILAPWRRNAVLLGSIVAAFSLTLCGVLLLLLRQVDSLYAAQEKIIGQQAEIALKTLQIDAASDVILLVRTDGTLVSFNSALPLLTGYSTEELAGKRLQDIEPPRNAEKVAVNMMSIKERGAAVFESAYLAKDGTVVPIEVHASVVNVTGTQYIVSVVRDIRERKATEAEHLRLEQQFLHAQKLESLGILAGGIAHDFNNLLTTILGNAGLALLTLPQDSPEADNIRQIEFAANRAAEFARQMLAYSGKGRFVVGPVDLTCMVEEMIPLLTSSVSRKADLRFALEPGLSAVEADAAQLRQVIMNLAINASEALADGTGRIDVRTTEASFVDGELLDGWSRKPLPSGRYVVIEVTDNGCGMATETVERIFDPFFTTKFTGRGLGMAAVQGIVRGHGGAIHIVSEAGRGSTFRVFLPAGERAVVVDGKGPVVVAAAWRGSGTVLLVDDEEAIRNVGVGILNSLGFDVVTADDGLAAVAAYRERGGFDLVILDLTMPKMDGAEAFRVLRGIDPAARIVLSSGFDEQEVGLKFAADAPNGFLQKPYSIASLREVLRKV